MLSLDQFRAQGIISEADTETIESYESNRSHYRENNFTYIPIPSSDKYYHVTDEELRDIDEDQYIPPELSMMAAFERLEKHPFLLVDLFMDFEYPDEGDQDFVPSGESNYDIMGETYTASEVVEESDSLLDELSDKESYAEKQVNDILWFNEERYHILTLADVNKRRSRELFYHVLSEFEIELSNLIKSHYPNSIIPGVKETEIERWYRAKIDELEIHITEHMNLSSLLKVGGKNEEIRGSFGFSSRSQFDEHLGGLNDLRHKVMHPTRALVHDKQDLEDHVDRVRRTQDVLKTLEENKPIDI
ncbi:hypothetical protein RH831_10985 [Halodesulfurarchaeum sp. HSR-GB]|uniref:hypothetical protein n=1 Tax=Halodesulfurarchaeum sp. HSR-GB TaxID=3074077 RepID=UPI0028610A67|nr:hypothetical protein [Halodesulfurarchaeum sp. HSR-GB]MDR5657700.1 hypothetical protein [Halodesulfurarchaeum sp. HSR-GB]